MNYELKSAVPRGLPYDKKDNPLDENSPVKYGVNVIIKTGIVGQTYDGFQNMDLGFCELLRTETINQALGKIEAYAIAFVATKYPNT